jgi:rubrerythrin
MVSQSQNSAAPVSNADDTSRDEKLARELQARYNAGQVVIAQPVNPQLPFNCGSCGTTHSVRNAAHGSQFKCTVCGAMNRIMTQQNSMVVVDNAYPIPIFCSIQ